VRNAEVPTAFPNIPHVSSWLMSWERLWRVSDNCSSRYIAEVKPWFDEKRDGLISIKEWLRRWELKYLSKMFGQFRHSKRPNTEHKSHILIQYWTTSAKTGGNIIQGVTKSMVELHCRIRNIYVSETPQLFYEHPVQLKKTNTRRIHGADNRNVTMY
jgi:hypothetical protein